MSSTANSQECDSRENPFCEDTDNYSPLDGGVSFMVGAAVFYGIKKSKKNRQCSNLTQNTY